VSAVWTNRWSIEEGLHTTPTRRPRRRPLASKTSEPSWTCTPRLFHPCQLDLKVRATSSKADLKVRTTSLGRVGRKRTNGGLAELSEPFAAPRLLVYRPVDRLRALGGQHRLLSPRREPIEPRSPTRSSLHASAEPTSRYRRKFVVRAECRVTPAGGWARRT